MKWNRKLVAELRRGIQKKNAISDFQRRGGGWMSKRDVRGTILLSV